MFSSVIFVISFFSIFGYCDVFEAMDGIREYLEGEIDYSVPFSCDHYEFEIQCLFDLRRRGSFLLILGDKKNLTVVSKVLRESFDDYYGYYLSVLLEEDVSYSIDRILSFLEFECNDIDERNEAIVTLIHLYDQFDDNSFDKYADEIFSIDTLSWESVYYLFTYAPTFELRNTYFHRMLKIDRDDTYTLLCYLLTNSFDELDDLEVYLLLVHFLGETELEMTVSDICEVEPSSYYGNYIKGAFDTDNILGSIDHLYKSMTSLHEMIQDDEDRFSSLPDPTIFNTLIENIGLRKYLLEDFETTKRIYTLLNSISPDLEHYEMLVSCIERDDENYPTNEAKLEEITRLLNEEDFKLAFQTGNEAEIFALLGLSRVYFELGEYSSCWESLEEIEEKNLETFLAEDQEVEFQNRKYLCGILLLDVLEDELEEEVLELLNFILEEADDPSVFYHIGKKYAEEGRFEESSVEYWKCIASALGEDTIEKLEVMEDEDEEMIFDVEITDLETMKRCHWEISKNYILLGDLEASELILVSLSKLLGQSLLDGYEVHFSNLFELGYIRELLQESRRVVEDVCCDDDLYYFQDGDEECHIHNIYDYDRFYCSQDHKFGILLYSCMNEELLFSEQVEEEAYHIALRNLKIAEDIRNDVCFLYDLRIHLYEKLNRPIEMILEVITDSLENCDTLEFSNAYKNIEERRLDYLVKKSYYHIVLEKYDMALEEVEVVMKYRNDPRNSDNNHSFLKFGMFNRAYSLEKLGRLRESLDVYMMIFMEEEFKTFGKGLFFRLGMVYLEMEDFENSLKFLRKSKELEVETGVVYVFQDELDSIDMIIQDVQNKLQNEL